MDLTFRSQALKVGTLHILGSAKGRDTLRNMTIDGADFGAVFTDGIVPAGVLVALYTGTAKAGKYGLYVTGAMNGLGTFAGITGEDVELQRLRLGDLPTTFHDVQCPLQWEGVLVAANLPTSSGFVSAAACAADAKPGVSFGFV